jgi:hypothetical protein
MEGRIARMKIIFDQDPSLPGRWDQNFNKKIIDPLKCTECDREVTVAVEMKSGNDDEYGPSYYCFQCIDDAKRMIG